MAYLTTRILVLAILSTSCAIGVLSMQVIEESVSDQQQTNGGAVDSLFDCQKYQQVFGKKYNSHDEAMTRCVYLLATALNVFASGVAFKYRKQNYYLAVNKFSDRSRQELDLMQNKAVTGRVVIEHQQAELKDYNNQKVDPTKIANELRAKIQKALEETQLDETLIDEVEGRRKKRNAPDQIDDDDQQELPKRHISIEMLIKYRKPVSDSDAIQKKFVRRPKVNNAKYARQMETMTQGLIDEREGIEAWEFMAPKENRIGSVVSSVTSTLDNFEKSLSTIKRLDYKTIKRFDYKKIKKLDYKNIGTQNLVDVLNSGRKLVRQHNKMFADLRTTGCFLPPRDQGFCGSCYAFASTAIVEYLYCKKVGFLTAFSEQYMVDCGKSLVDNLNGCSGASSRAAPEFIHDFGMELQANYPYLGRETECPYDNDTKRETTGYIRYELGNVVAVPVKHWPLLLKNGHPLFVMIAANGGFESYGGGIYDGQECAQPNHHVVLVGHGREDGQEYWLFRNSYGRDWGDDGYLKLAKSAPATCIDLQQGFLFGTKDAIRFKEPIRNELNKNAIYKKGHTMPREGTQD